VTALHLAVQRGNADAVRCLLSAGADVDVADTRYGRTALYYAVERNDLAVTELLVSYGANPALVTSSGPTVSAARARNCSTDMPKLLQPAISYHLPACCPTGTILQQSVVFQLQKHSEEYFCNMVDCIGAATLWDPCNVSP